LETGMCHEAGIRLSWQASKAVTLGCA